MRFWPKCVQMAVCLLALGAPSWTQGELRGDASGDVRALPLLDHEGKAVSLRAFEGRTLVLHFIFTRCLSACHVQVRELRAVRAALAPDTRERVQFVSVSIDPEQDTPETLRRYAQANGIADAGWRFATASPEVVGQFTESLAVKRQPLLDGQIDHALVVFLFDARGRLVQRYTNPNVDTARLAREIADVDKIFGQGRSQ